MISPNSNPSISSTVEGALSLGASWTSSWLKCVSPIFTSRNIPANQRKRDKMKPCVTRGSNQGQCTRGNKREVWKSWKPPQEASADHCEILSDAEVYIPEKEPDERRAYTCTMENVCSGRPPVVRGVNVLIYVICMVYVVIRSKSHQSTGQGFQTYQLPFSYLIQPLTMREGNPLCNSLCNWEKIEYRLLKCPENAPTINRSTTLYLYEPTICDILSCTLWLTSRPNRALNRRIFLSGLPLLHLCGVITHWIWQIQRKWINEAMFKQRPPLNHDPRSEPGEYEPVSSSLSLESIEGNLFVQKLGQIVKRRNQTMNHVPYFRVPFWVKRLAFPNIGDVHR